MAISKDVGDLCECGNFVGSQENNFKEDIWGIYWRVYGSTWDPKPTRMGYCWHILGHISPGFSCIWVWVNMGLLQKMAIFNI